MQFLSFIYHSPCPAHTPYSYFSWKYIFFPMPSNIDSKLSCNLYPTSKPPFSPCIGSSISKFEFTTICSDLKNPRVIVFKLIVARKLKIYWILSMWSSYWIRNFNFWSLNSESSSPTAETPELKSTFWILWFWLEICNLWPQKFWKWPRLPVDPFSKN